MLTLRNNLRITLILGLALLFSITAEALADKSTRQARQQARQQRTAERRAQTQQRQQANQTARTQRRTMAIQKRAQSQAARQVRVEQRQQVTAERRTQNQVQRQQRQQQQTERRAENQAQRQQSKQVRVERRDGRRQQTQQRRDDRTATRAESQRGINRQVTRNVDIKRTITPRGTKVTIDRNIQRTITRNGNTFTRNVDSTIVRQFPNRYSRPRASRSHHGQKGKSPRFYSHVVGRRPGRIFNHVIWPKYRYPVYYRHGRRHFVHYVRPRYHRKYVFFSIGSYWPAYYTSVRYYWYGSHPYQWYGSYPTAYAAGSDTYNYYTYNTYNYDTAAPTTYSDAAPLDSVDHITFEDVREKLDEQGEPEPETLTDKFFQDGVVAFEQQDYNVAAAAFADAIALDPDDLILPFAYVQALFASEQYFKAADILRLALEQMPADQQGLFFPRGLYAEDEILFEQIEKLQTRAKTFSYDPDLPLLLGYQLIGVEQHEDARKWLDRAAQYELNENSTNILNELLDKLQEQPEQTSQSL